MYVVLQVFHMYLEEWPEECSSQRTYKHTHHLQAVWNGYLGAMQAAGFASDLPLYVATGLLTYGANEGMLWVYAVPTPNAIPTHTPHHQQICN